MLARLSTLKVLRSALCAIALVLLALPLSTGPAAARVGVVVGFGFAGPPAYYYAPGYYYPYYYPYYYAPPPVVYAPAPVYSPAPAAVAPPPAAAPSSAYQPAGQTCRQYQTTVTVDGQTQPGFGTACLQPDGTWRMIN
jgi:hypothetical protein